MTTKKLKNKIVAKRKSGVKKKVTKIMGRSINPLEDKDIIQKKLTGLAHSGTKEALDTISEFIGNTQDEDLRGFAKCAYDEADFFYYSPANDQEEKELLVAKMIKTHDARLWKLMNKADSAKLELRELGIEREIDIKIFKAEHGTEDGWGYEEPDQFSEDYYTMVKMRLEEIEGGIDYESAWIREAEKMIKTEKYKNVPADFFEHLRFDGEGGTFWTDEAETDYEEKICQKCGCEHDTDKISGNEKIEDVPF